ncbi:unnamed protein product [Closterium sp. NIES-65]|nr:unnamed protein product [Closterium sp. NIES-65]
MGWKLLSARVRARGASLQAERSGLADGGPCTPTMLSQPSPCHASSHLPSSQPCSPTSLRASTFLLSLAQSPPRPASPSPISLVSPTLPTRFPPFLSLPREQGFWRGTVPGLLLVMPYTAIQFVVIHRFKSLMTGSHRTEDHKQLRPELSFVGGSVAGMAATVGSYPFDLLRTVLASQGEPKVYAGMRAACMGIVRERGVRGLFAGLPPTMVEIIPYAGLQFGLYDAFKRHLAHYNWSRSKARHDRPVSLAHSHLPSTAPSTAPLSPPLSPSPSSSPSLSPAAAPPAVASAVERAARPAVSSGQLSAWQQFMCGLAAGTLAKVACHPLDVVKKRFQVEGLRRHPRYGARIQPRAYRGMVDALRKIVATEGVEGLYKGVLPSVIKAAPSAAITFFVYELVAKFLEEMSSTDV